MAENYHQKSVPKPSAKWVWLAVIILAVMSAHHVGLFGSLSPSTLLAQRQLLGDWVTQNLWIACLIYLLVYTMLVAVSFPAASFITIMSGFLFGLWIGTVLTVVAATMGATIIFLVLRYFVGERIIKRLSGRVSALAEGILQNAFHYLLFLRLVPAFPFFLVNAAPALLNVPLGTYIAATFIGIIPGTAAYTFIGVGLDSIVAEQIAANPQCRADPSCAFELDVGALFTREMMLAFLVLAALSLVPILIKRLRVSR